MWSNFSIIKAYWISIGSRGQAFITAVLKMCNLFRWDPNYSLDLKKKTKQQISLSPAFLKIIVLANVLHNNHSNERMIHFLRLNISSVDLKFDHDLASGLVLCMMFHIWFSVPGYERFLYYAKVDRWHCWQALHIKTMEESKRKRMEK